MLFRRKRPKEFLCKQARELKGAELRCFFDSLKTNEMTQIVNELSPDEIGEMFIKLASANICNDEITPGMVKDFDYSELKPVRCNASQEKMFYAPVKFDYCCTENGERYCITDCFGKSENLNIVSCCNIMRLIYSKGEVTGVFQGQDSDDDIILSVDDELYRFKLEGCNIEIIE